MSDIELKSNLFAVYCPGEPEPLLVEAENWVFALGTALDLIDRAEWVSRLACEIHPDGTVVAEDRVTGAGYIVQRVRSSGRPRTSREPGPQRSFPPPVPSADSRPSVAR